MAETIQTPGPNALTAVPNAVLTIDPKLAEGRTVYRFVLLRGRHVDRQGKWDPTAENKNFPPDHEKRLGRYSIRVFQVNKQTKELPEFETITDLSKQAYNPAGYPPRFRRADKPQTETVYIDPMQRRPGETVAAYVLRIRELASGLIAAAEGESANLMKMSLEDLQSFAADNEIDLGSAKTLDQVRSAVRKYMNPKG